MALVTIPAHFDGEHIRLDEVVRLDTDTRLLVTVLPPQDEVREAWVHLSLAGLARAYAEDEPEYPLSAVKEANAEYDGG